jgi:peptidoglycan/xylan/chitin deacetylase (PgdA/CDA1 family)
MLHHIRRQQEPYPGFHPNSCLETTPDFLDAVLSRLKVQGIEFVSLREAIERLRRGEDGSRFAAFTIDDGYADNCREAWPIFARHDCPFTVFVATKIVDGEAELWWLALEQIVAANEAVTACIDGKQSEFATASAAEKTAAYNTIYWYWRSLPEHEQRRKARNLCSRYTVDLKKICRREAMTWDDLRKLSADPLVTIGAHTVNHVALAKLDEIDARHEMRSSKRRLEEELQIDVDYFCYPYGDPGSAGPREFDLADELGFKAAVTTRKGLLYGEHADHLTSLPRVSLNGDYECLRYIDLYLSGAPFALWNGFRRVDAA